MSDGGPAFPRAAFYTDQGPPVLDHGPQDGMTLRQYYIGQALAGAAAQLMLDPQCVRSIAAKAVALADAALAAEQESQS